ncbi:MAG TPA: hypothetical protein VE760_02135, partial [Acidimicrobiales bacterium]|nr:hypothetical protein [Acidimicrobiales bacterium]
MTGPAGPGGAAAEEAVAASATPDVGDVEARALARVEAASSVADLDAARQEFLGKRSPFSSLHRGLGALPVAERREVGRAIHEASARVEAAVAERRAVLEATERSRRLEAERLDVTEVVGRVERG